MTTTAVATPVVLSTAEAAHRRAERGPVARPATSRSYASIVRANVFTIFNLILLVAGVATLAFGEWQDALFLGVLVSNSAIGIAQEVRAKHALDRLAALVAPDALVVRDGVARRVAVEDVVVGDLARVQAGDQVVADGKLVDDVGLAVDESILTGESRPAVRTAGDELRSGSFVVEGAGAFVVEAVGEDSYAARIVGEARTFRHPRSPLERALNRLLITLVCVIVPLGLTLGIALWERRTPLSTAVPTTVAAVVTLVPEGLILLASLTYAVGALRMARRGALAQQLNAIESIAAVDVVCLDKTGTLTEPRLRVVTLVATPSEDDDTLRGAVASYAASAATRNATVEALAAAYPVPAEAPHSQVAFSSTRRFGVRARDRNPRGAAPRRGGGHRVVLPQSGRRAEGALGRPPRDGRRGRARHRHPRRARSRRTRAAGGPGGAAPARARQRRRRTHLTRRETPRRRSTPRRRPLCRDDRRRRQRRSRAQGGTARDRAGYGFADGPERCGPRPRARRLRSRAGARRRRTPDAAQPLPRREAVRHEVGVRRRAHPLDRLDADGLPAAAAASDARCVADDRHPRVLPRARAVVGHVRGPRLPAGDRPLRGAGRDGSGARRPLELPVRPQRRRPRSTRSADGGHDVARRNGPVPRARPRSRWGSAQLLRLGSLRGARAGVPRHPRNSLHARFLRARRPERGLDRRRPRSGRRARRNRA